MLQPAPGAQRPLPPSKVQGLPAGAGAMHVVGTIELCVGHPQKNPSAHRLSSTSPTQGFPTPPSTHFFDFGSHTRPAPHRTFPEQSSPAAPLRAHAPQTFDEPLQ